MKERDNMVRQIANREKEIAYLTKRLADSLMPNQKALLQAQRARQVAMLDADQLALDNLKTSLAHSVRK
jgi:hypothetical protein